MMNLSDTQTVWVLLGVFLAWPASQYIFIPLIKAIFLDVFEKHVKEISAQGFRAKCYGNQTIQEFTGDVGLKLSKQGWNITDLFKEVKVIKDRLKELGLWEPK